MRRNKFFITATVFVFGIILMMNLLSSYSVLNPQITSPGYLNSQRVNAFPSFDEKQCNAGQDFLIQIPPFGCEPAVVRSDLLEEQNVPVFCQLTATKLNPLIDVNAVNFISFTGEYPEEIAGIGFHPAKAALSSSRTTLLNTPLLENIGYAVIVLKQQKNESSMPDFVSGNLTANIKYDVENAFGVGKATYYLPEFNQDEWNEKFEQYGFWNRKGFLRAEGIDENSAFISVYLDKTNRFASFNLEKGEASSELSLPGFYCQANVEFRLDDLKTPDTRAKLNINGDVFQIAKGEKFLDNACSVRNIVPMGIREETEIGCRTDEGVERFKLISSPKINFKITDEETKEEKTMEAEIGERLYSLSGEAVYLAYAGTDTNKKDDLFVYLIKLSQDKERLNEDELNSVNTIVKNIRKTRITGVGAADIFLNGLRAYVGAANLAYQSLNGNKFYKIDFNLQEKWDNNICTHIFGFDISCDDITEVEKKWNGIRDNKKIRLVGFGEVVNAEFGDENVKLNYENAMSNYKSVYESFPSEKENPESTETFGRIALRNAIGLAFKSNQKTTASELCRKFNEDYPEDKSDVLNYCDEIKISSSEISSHSVFINGKVKNILLEGIYEPSFDEFGAEIIVVDSEGKSKKFSLSKNEKVFLNDEGNDFIQLGDLTENSAKLRVGFGGVGTEDVLSDTKTITKDVSQKINKYVLTLTKVNLKKVARVSILPRADNVGTEANFSFSIGIEKRAIQFTPDKIQEKINHLNDTITKWEGTSEKLGNVVRGFNAACLAIGATLTIKNFLDNLDGKAIARQEVMRSDGGWYDICNEEMKTSGDSLNKCLSKHSDEIEKDVDLVEKIINEQEEINNQNVKTRIDEIKSGLSDVATLDANVDAALSEDGFNKSLISLSQLRDIERLKTILKSSDSNVELRNIAEKNLEMILNDIKANAGNFAESTNLAEKFGISSDKISFVEVGKDVRTRTYNDLKYGDISNKVTLDKSLLEITSDNPVEIVHTNEGGKYIVVLDASGSRDKLPIRKAAKVGGGERYLVYDELGKLVDEDKIPLELRGNIVFQRFDSVSYKNEFKNPQVRYFETTPYKGLPAIVPFDKNNGWYAAMRQTLPGFGNIRTYDNSGQIVNFYLCNVGRNGREEFNSNLGDDDCRSFNSVTNEVNGKFQGLNPDETNQKVSQAVKAIGDASKQYTAGVSGSIRILNQYIPVGTPAVGVPDLQCQDFMSPDECLLLFNTCDPVVCPSSRCNLGGTYHVPDVVQSGIVGSSLLCLPNIKEGIVVPVCLSGVKAGIDSLVSVERNYRDCLQNNLETGETIGICDEIHSIYLCDFFWSQLQPLSQVAVPKAFEFVTGQGGRGGGEYLGVKSAWDNAGKSIDYMTNYYGAASFEAFKTGIIKQVGNQICRSFVSVAYPSSAEFFNSLIEPESPPQYTAWFSEGSFTTATIPPISRYKVFYHVFAGENEGAYYSVYLKNPVGSSFYQVNPTLSVASGFIPTGDYASETKDFTAPSGYQELCVRVNAQEECGFERVTTDFSLDYLNDLYLQQQSTEKINSEKECVAGTPSVYSFINPNLQAGVQEFLNPNVYEQVVRVCSTDNPGKGTDANADGEGSRWIEVGMCDESGKLKCYLDTDSVRRVIKSTSIENETLGEISEEYVRQLMEEGEFMQNFEGEIRKLSEMKEKGQNNEIIGIVTQEFIDSVFYNYQKAKLFMIRGDAYMELVLIAFEVIERGTKEELCDPLKESCPAVAVPIGAEWTRRAAFAEAQKRLEEGKIRYEYNKAFIEELCETEILTESDCEKDSLRGSNAVNRLINLLEGGWNVETALERAEKLKSEKKVSFDDDEVREFFEQLREDGVLDELYTKDMSDIAYKSFEQNPDAIGNLITLIKLEESGQKYKKHYAADCSTGEECQISIGREIMNFVRENREELGIEVEKGVRGLDERRIKEEGVAENFECLILQIAMHESSLQHCKKFQENENPLYCDGNSEEVLKGDSGISFGVMQINTLAHKIAAQSFEKNVFYGANLVFNHYQDTRYSKGREYKCNGETYSGWEGALRLYNGWNTDCTKGDKNYVENVIARKEEVAKLFPVCGGAAKGTIKINECVEDVEWVDDELKTIDVTKDVKPGRVYVKFKIKSIDVCGDYSLVIYNPEIFGSPETKFDIGKEGVLRKIKNYYYLPYEVNLIKKSIINYDPAKYKFKMINPFGEIVFEGETITVDTIYAF